MGKFEKIYVLDTNVLLNDAQNLVLLSDNGKNLIVLPETTIDEIDNKKSGFTEINYQARSFGRLLQHSEVKNVVKPNDNVTLVEVTINENIIIHIMSFKDYGLVGIDSSILNDRKIIKVAEFASEYYQNIENTILISDDIMCRTRAISLQVKTSAMVGDKKDDELQLIKELPLDSSLFKSLDNKPIQEIDKDYIPENYCYCFFSEDGNKVYGYIVNERINIITEDLFKALKVKPLNVGQKFATAGILDSRIDLCEINAMAGSGKTLLSISAGMRLIDLGKFDKLLYIRNSIESTDKGEEVGFLSGNEEKFKIYNYPLYDSLDFIVNSGKTKKAKLDEASNEDKVIELIKKYQIETLWIGSLRGRSLDNAFIIVDEYANMSKKSLQTVLTRVGKNCKVCLVGSNNQIDNPYINKYTNGASAIKEALKTSNEDITLFSTSLNKVVRGKITEFAEKLLTPNFNKD